MIQRNFWRNVLPSVIAFAFSGVYSIVDGMFVGQGVGDAGLAAINVAWPVTSVTTPEISLKGLVYWLA